MARKSTTRIENRRFARTIVALRRDLAEQLLDLFLQGPDFGIDLRERTRWDVAEQRQKPDDQYQPTPGTNTPSSVQYPLRKARAAHGDP
jgi:hypothetical protein